MSKEENIESLGSLPDFIENIVKQRFSEPYPEIPSEALWSKIEKANVITEEEFVQRIQQKALEVLKFHKEISVYDLKLILETEFNIDEKDIDIEKSSESTYLIELRLPYRTVHIIAGTINIEKENKND